MKVLVDENLSPALARSLHALFNGDHLIIHVREKFDAGISDIEWIEALNSEGRWAVLSGDRRITRNRAEYNAFRNSKLIGFFLSKGVYKSPVTRQAVRILTLWDTMCQLADNVEGGAMFELPMTSSRLQQMK